jgi:uncharacterized RDD family membrane protein YckC
MSRRRSTRSQASASPAPLTSPEAPVADEPLATAGVTKRLCALVYDGFLLFGLWVVPLLIAMVALHSSEPPPAELGGVVHELPPIAPPWMIQLYAVVMVVVFYGYFWRRNGQTLAMQAWRIRLDSVDGGRPSWKQCLIRLAVGALSLLCFGLGYFWLWWDRDGLTWHDRASRTRVVQVSKR